MKNKKRVKKEKLKEQNKNRVFFAVVLALLVVSIFLVYYFSPVGIVAFFGVENVYIVAFLISLFGGISTLTGGFVYTSVVAFVLGGANPLILGVSAGIGFLLSDFFFYYVSSESHKILSVEIQERARRFHEKYKGEKNFFPIFLFFYMAFIPLPNDIVLFPAGISGYPMKRVIIPIILGDLVNMILVSYMVFFALSL